MTNHSDTELVSSTTYYYRIRAHRHSDDAYSAFSNIASATTHPSPPLDPPANVQASDGTYSDKVRITWNAVTGATNYQVLRSPSPDGVKINLGSPAGTTFDDTTPTPNVTYYYFVQACQNTVCSDFSDFDTGWRNGPNPGPPVDVYFLVDLTGSFNDDLQEFKSHVPAIIAVLKAVNPNTRFGLGRFEDYPINPFGSAAAGDRAYQRVVDLTFDTHRVLNTVSSLSTRDGLDFPESQLPALYQAATGAGQDLSGAGYPGASIPQGQQAHFRPMPSSCSCSGPMPLTIAQAIPATFLIQAPTSPTRLTQFVRWGREKYWLSSRLMD